MNKKQLAQQAHAAWQKAIADKKDAAGIKALKDAYDLALKAWQDEETAALEAPAADPNVITLAQINDSITKSVEAAFKDKLGDKLTPELLAQITPESIKAHVAAALAEHQAAGDAKAILQPANLKALMDAVVQKQLADLKLPNKMQHQAQAHQPGERGQVEIPFSLTKGNLPLHMKQLLNILTYKRQDEGVDKADLQVGLQHENKFWIDLQMQGVKALTTTGTGTGAEWIPRSLSSELYRRMYLDSQLAQSFLAQEVQMPTDPYDYPLITTDPTFYLNNVENTEPPASEMGSSGFTLTTQNIMALVQYSYKVDEDSIIPILPTLQFSLARAGARALEDALINGDTTATHMDTGSVVAFNDVKRAWKGFRKLALAVAALKVDLSTGGLGTRANILSVLRLLGKYAARTQDVSWIVGTKGWTSLLTLDEVALAYARGGVGSYIAGGPTPAPWGGMIDVSEQNREDLNAAGVWDNVTTTKGSILAVNRAGFVMGSRREFMIEVDRNIKSQTHDIVASFRKAFSPIEVPSATNQTVAIGYNYTA